MQFKPNTIFEAAQLILHETYNAIDAEKVIRYLIQQKKLKNSTKEINKTLDMLIKTYGIQNKEQFKKDVLDRLDGKYIGVGSAVGNYNMSVPDSIHDPNIQAMFGL